MLGVTVDSFSEPELGAEGGGGGMGGGGFSQKDFIGGCSTPKSNPFLTPFLTEKVLVSSCLPHLSYTLVTEISTLYYF